MDKKMEIYTWEQMDETHRVIARQIEESGYDPEVIIGIQRCGLVPATHLAYILGLRDVESIQVISTENDEALPERAIEAFVNFKPKVEIEGKRILLVDAVVDTGTTVNLCIDKLENFSVGEVRVATISDWPHSEYALKFGDRRPKIDYVGFKSTDWPDFPWEH